MTSLAGMLVGAGFAAGVLVLVVGFMPRPQRPATRTRRAAATKPAGTGFRFTRAEQLRGLGALGAGVVLAVFFGWVVAILLAPVMAVGIPRLLRMPSSVNPDRLEALEEWTRALHGLLSSNLPLVSAIAATLPSTPKAIHPEVERLVARLQARRAIDQSLYAFADDLGDHVGDFIASALIQGAASSSAGLSRVLDALAVEVADEVRMRRDIEIERQKALSQSKWLTLIVCVGVPAFILFTKTGETYHSPLGQLVLLALAGAFAGCLLWIRKTATTTPPTRFLVTPADVIRPMAEAVTR